MNVSFTAPSRISSASRSDAFLLMRLSLMTTPFLEPRSSMVMSFVVDLEVAVRAAPDDDLALVGTELVRRALVRAVHHAQVGRLIVLADGREHLLHHLLGERLGALDRVVVTQQLVAAVVERDLEVHDLDEVAVAQQLFATRADLLAVVQRAVRRA
jgi:hypothetical protein